MVGAKHDDELVKSAVHLLVVIADVWKEVCVAAILLDDWTILVIKEVAGSKISGSFAFIDITFFLKESDCVGDG